MRNTEKDIATADVNAEHNSEQPVSGLQQEVLMGGVLNRLGPSDVLNLNATCRFFNSMIPLQNIQNAAKTLKYNIPYLMKKLGSLNASENYIKCVFVGDTNSNKVQVTLHYRDPLADRGVDYCLKNFEVDNNKLRVQMWDTAGQERNRNITKLYYRDAGVFVCVANSANPRLHQGIADWLNHIEQNTVEQNQEIPVVKVVLINTIADGNPLTQEQFTQLTSGLKNQFGDDLLCSQVNSASNIGIHEALDSAIGYRLHHELQVLLANNHTNGDNNTEQVNSKRSGNATVGLKLDKLRQ